MAAPFANRVHADAHFRRRYLVRRILGATQDHAAAVGQGPRHPPRHPIIIQGADQVMSKDCPVAVPERRRPSHKEMLPRTETSVRPATIPEGEHRHRRGAAEGQAAPKALIPEGHRPEAPRDTVIVRKEGYDETAVIPKCPAPAVEKGAFRW